eukprot:TRINITY_DN7625_c0_g1_i2.p1 TRINITY_DN7625_c0_g1~~TRINITY_DN7625_c0_g1_i2.p1  ORF type:complete len:580 (-),score=163.38 TRINITY_DN7625_c0_g1_i2:106-1845(-)
MASGDGGQLATLYVGDLNADVSEADLHSVFSPHGPVALIHVCRDAASRKSLGYAYVNYYSKSDAQGAMDKLNYTDIKGRCCRIMWHSKQRQKAQGDPEANVFVKNLDSTVDSKALYDTFSLFGNILSCKVSTDSIGRSRGYGFVQYESTDAAKQAIERVNGMLIGERKVFVGPCLKRGESAASGGSDCSLYVKNIPADWDDEKVTSLFSTYGELESTLIVDGAKTERRYGFVNFKDADSAAKAVAELHGKDLRSEEEKQAGGDQEEKEMKAGEEGDADKQDKIPAHCLFVGKAKSKSEREAEVKAKMQSRQERFEGIKLYVRNLPADTTDEILKKAFDEFGKVTDVKAVIDRESNECKGYGFVRYATMDEANAAIAGLHLKEAFPEHPPIQVSLRASKGEKGEKGEKGQKGKGSGKGKGGLGGFKGKGMGPPGHQGMMPPMFPGGMPPMFPGTAPGAGGRPPAAMPPPFGMPPMAMMRPGMPFPGMPGMMGMPPRPGMPMPGFPGFPGVAMPGPPQVSTKQAIGERLYPKVHKLQPQQAGKLTGMILEMSEKDLQRLLDDDSLLEKKVTEAMEVLSRKK